MIAREVVVERRELLGAQLLELDHELGRLPGETRVGMVGRIRNAQREPGPTMLTDELVLQRQGKTTTTGLEEHRLAVSGLSPVEAARQIDGDHVPGFDEVA